jgi:hypothetical protein
MNHHILPVSKKSVTQVLKGSVTLPDMADYVASVV